MTAEFRFERAQVLSNPFLHFVAPEFIDEDLGEALLAWFEQEAPWIEKKVEAFYESHDLSLQHSELPERLRFLVEEAFLGNVRAQVAATLNARLGPRVDVTAHRLSPGQYIKVHSDFGETKQTHRLLVQLNRGWTMRSGGLLMFFSSPVCEEPSERDCYYLPENRTAFCFEVSPHSLHAVSRVEHNQRYTLCLSFYGDDDA